MAHKYGDSEDQRVIDRIRANAYREAMEAGAEFINRKWIGNKLARSLRWVTDNWRSGYDQVYAMFSCGPPETLSQESKDIIVRSSGKRRRSNANVANEINEIRGKNIDKHLVGQYRIRMGLKAFHVLPKPMKNAVTIENRLWFCNFLSKWDEDDFLHLCPSDEFFIYTIRRPNKQNDRIWALNLDEIEDVERYQDVCKYPCCIGIFLAFTAKRLLWVIKEEGQTWTGAYFREHVLENNVFPFLRDRNNVLDCKEVCFLHDSAPCFRANETQEFMKSSGIDFFDRTEWPGNSPDLNAAEHIGSVLKDKVESKMIKEYGPDRYSKEKLLCNLNSVLKKMEFDTDLFESLLKSYPLRLQAVREANGSHTKY